VSIWGCAFCCRFYAGSALIYARKSLNNRFFELKVGQNFNPLLFISLSQEHAGRGLHKHCLDLTGCPARLAFSSL
jgi:hypothetical protein